MYLIQYLNKVVSCIIRESISNNIKILTQDIEILRSKEHKNRKISHISINDIISRGCRGIPALFTNVSGVSQTSGQYIRNILLEDLQHKNPIAGFLIISSKQTPN